MKHDRVPEYRGPITELRSDGQEAQLLVDYAGRPVSTPEERMAGLRQEAQKLFGKMPERAVMQNPGGFLVPTGEGEARRSVGVVIEPVNKADVLVGWSVVDSTDPVVVTVGRLLTPNLGGADERELRNALLLNTTMHEKMAEVNPAKRPLGEHVMAIATAIRAEIATDRTHKERQRAGVIARQVEQAAPKPAAVEPMPAAPEVVPTDKAGKLELAAKVQLSADIKAALNKPGTFLVIPVDGKPAAVRLEPMKIGVNITGWRIAEVTGNAGVATVDYKYRTELDNMPQFLKIALDKTARAIGGTSDRLLEQALQLEERGRNTSPKMTSVRSERPMSATAVDSRTNPNSPSAPSSQPTSFGTFGDVRKTRVISGGTGKPKP